MDTVQREREDERGDGDPDQREIELGPTLKDRMQWLFRHFPKEPEQRGPRGGLVRAARPYKQVEIAELTGTSANYIGQICNGTAKRVTVDLARRIAQAFGAPEGVLANSEQEFQLFATLHELGIPPERVTLLFRGGDPGDPGNFTFLRNVVLEWLKAEHPQDPAAGEESPQRS
ncbi:transcriptional regulator [Amycolatopsis magusensis]|uniref:transcriptional regulator n=1 Tax=Amycolatopsis magusensis TaxID=882444 RepID=UPI0037A3C92B